MELRTCLAAFRNAPEDLIEKGKQKLKDRFPDIRFRFVTGNPDIICFLSGGSEQEAIKCMVPGRHYLLLAGFEGNAWAAATEVKAWADQNNVPAQLISVEEQEVSQRLEIFHRVCTAFRNLTGKQAGLIGNVSHWLVASAFPLNLAKERLGIEIRHLQWASLPDYISFPPDPEFSEVFKNNTQNQLENEARIYSFLKSVIKEHHLEGLTLECFDMVNKHNVTACLALALLNSRGIASGCEGDLVSVVGMMMVQALTGTIPWMANIAGMNDQSIIFAHCTAPLNLVSGFGLPTHFETNKSAAVQGDLNMKEVTVFRLNQNLNKAFISTGKVVSQPALPYACRTQTEIVLPKLDLEILRNKPLGNHHLIIPGEQRELLTMACRYKQIAL